MWYILYDEMLSKYQRGERNVGRAFFTHRALSTDLRRNGRTWWWNPMVFCSQEFVIVLCKNFLYRFLYLFYVYQSCVTDASLISDISVSRNYTASRKKATFQQVVFHRSWNFREQSNLNSLTRTQIHEYILQVVNFYRFYYRSLFFN